MLLGKNLYVLHHISVKITVDKDKIYNNIDSYTSILTLRLSVSIVNNDESFSKQRQSLNI